MLYYLIVSDLKYPMGLGTFFICKKVSVIPKILTNDILVLIIRIIKGIKQSRRKEESSSSMRLTAKTYSKEILKDIKDKKILIYEREKNLIFIHKYRLSVDEIEEIIYGLTEYHFKEKIENEDKKINADYLYVFKAGVNINDGFGEKYEYIYIKICEIKPNILIVSLHLDE